MIMLKTKHNTDDQNMKIMGYNNFIYMNIYDATRLPKKYKLAFIND